MKDLDPISTLDAADPLGELAELAQHSPTLYRMLLARRILIEMLEQLPEEASRAGTRILARVLDQEITTHDALEFVTKLRDQLAHCAGSISMRRIPGCSIADP